MLRPAARPAWPPGQEQTADDVGARQLLRSDAESRRPGGGAPVCTASVPRWRRPAPPRPSPVGPSAAITAAAMPSVIARTRPTHASTTSRRTRSAIVAANGATRAAGAIRRRPTSPIVAAPPSRNATTPSATVAAHSPLHIAPNASCARLRFRLRKFCEHAAAASAIRALARPIRGLSQLVLSDQGRGPLGMGQQAGSSRSSRAPLRMVRAKRREKRSHRSGASSRPMRPRSMASVIASAKPAVSTLALIWSHAGPRRWR